MSKEITPLAWEQVPQNHGDILYRAWVPGGWLIKNTDEVLSPIDEGYDKPSYKTGYEWRTTICFMPDVNHMWGEVSKPVTDNHDA